MSQKDESTPVPPRPALSPSAPRPSAPRPRWSSQLGRPGYKVCVAITGATRSEMMARAESVLAEHAFLELRLDFLSAPLLSRSWLAASLHVLLQKHPQACLIATCRRTAAGGAFQGQPQEEVELLLAAAEAGCSLVDLAVESAEELGEERTASLREALHSRGTGLLVSYHDYQGTTELEQSWARLLRHQPDAGKLVSTATSLADTGAILRLLGKARGSALVGIAMGQPGVASRILGPRAGGLFTFASAASGSETAAGQIAASTLKQLYRIEQLSAATRVYGVAGKPIGHSLSPLLHNTGFRCASLNAGLGAGLGAGLNAGWGAGLNAGLGAGLNADIDAGIDAVLVPLETDSAEDLLRLARELPIHGLAVTMPLKEQILPHLDRVDALAAKVGACNTVVRGERGELHGLNTDVSGVVAPLEQRLSLKGARVLVEGAGGAARAAVFGLQERGAEVWVHNRTRAKAAALAAEAGVRLAEGTNLKGTHFDILVNATPSGMAGIGAAEPAPGIEALGFMEHDSVENAPLPAHLVFDLIYSPLETPLIQRARAQGLPVITGAEMFLEQGARQFELWTGRPAPRAEMRRVVLAALLGEEKQQAERAEATEKDRL